MKKIILVCLAATLCSSAMAQKSGIRFFSGTWDQAVEKARQEKKMIFVDFFTEWCGPCMNMAQKIFVLPEVGDIYNRNFVCMKIDAEKGEGVELARKYGVRSYPCYVFVDPDTQEEVHRSGSNKSAERFIYDAEGALDPARNSTYLEKAYAAGGYDDDLLMRYIRYKDATLSRDVPKLFDELIGMGHTLKEPAIWEIYVSAINGYDNPYLREVSENYDTYTQLYGKDAVDAKLTSATAYAPIEVLEGLAAFKGREHNIAARRLTELLQSQQYGQAYQMLRTMQGDPAVDQRKLVEQMSFYTRTMSKGREDETPFDTLIDKIRLTRYVAYNTYDRDEAMPHYNYALALEYLIERAAREGRTIPADLFAAPEFGKPEYDMRHPELKQKPTRR